MRSLVIAALDSASTCAALPAASDDSSRRLGSALRSGATHSCAKASSRFGRRLNALSSCGVQYA